MTPARDAASDEPHATLLIQLLKTEEVAREIEEAYHGRRTPRLEAHAHVLEQCRRERRPPLSPLHLHPVQHYLPLLLLLPLPLLLLLPLLLPPFLLLLLPLLLFHPRQLAGWR